MITKKEDMMKLMPIYAYLMYKLPNKNAPSFREKMSNRDIRLIKLSKQNINNSKVIWRLLGSTFLSMTNWIYYMDSSNRCSKGFLYD